MIDKALPAPERTYAIGDIHGHAGKLDAIHLAIERDLQAHGPSGALIVHLGDYIDRGPDSAACLERLMRGSPIDGVATACLMGNHERMMLDALQDDRLVPQWLDNGGAETLRSFGVAGSRAGWRARIPADTVAFLGALPLYRATPGYLFVHAGVRPGIRLPMQVDHDLLWIRDEFLRWNGTMLPDAPALRIVHGHTPVSQPEVRHNRIGIDTNAARGGNLTCAVLCQDSVYFLQA